MALGDLIFEAPDRQVVDHQTQILGPAGQEPSLHQGLFLGRVEVRNGSQISKRHFHRRKRHLHFLRARLRAHHGVAHGSGHGFEETDGHLPPPADDLEVRLAERAVLAGRRNSGVGSALRPHLVHDGREDDEPEHHQDAEQSKHHLLILTEYLEWAGHGTKPLCRGIPLGRIRLDKLSDGVLMVSRRKSGRSPAILRPIDVNAIPKRAPGHPEPLHTAPPTSPATARCGRSSRVDQLYRPEQGLEFHAQVSGRR